MTPKEAKNYVAGTLERDQPYERLLRQVVLEGELTHDRTGVGTLSTFGTRMEVNLPDLTVGASVLSAEMIASGMAT